MLESKMCFFTAHSCGVKSQYLLRYFYYHTGERGTNAHALTCSIGTAQFKPAGWIFLFCYANYVTGRNNNSNPNPDLIPNPNLLDI